MNTIEAENLVLGGLNRISDRIGDTCRFIHRHPEPGLSEHKACRFLLDQVRSEGFSVVHPVAGMDTAFTASFKSAKKGPHIAFLAEYDALPDLGHACGHNVIAAAALGAAVALKPAVELLGGEVSLFGTRDEEAFGPDAKGGKVTMIEAGLFDTVDAALMVHPTAGPGGPWRFSFPLIDFFVRYHGKPAHYTRPHEGINALEALLLFLHSVQSMKRGWSQGVMFAYTITDGGGPSAITVPQKAEAHITMKAFYTEYLDELFSSVRACAKNVGAVMGAEARVEVISRYKSMVPNLVLTRLMHEAQKAAGEMVESPLNSAQQLARLSYPGISTDFGDVSRIVPGIHGYCSIGGPELVGHTPEFALAAGGPEGEKAALRSAKAMAMSGVKLLADPDLAPAMKQEFESYKKGGFLNVPAIPPGYRDFPEEFKAAMEG